MSTAPAVAKIISTRPGMLKRYISKLLFVAALIALWQLAYMLKLAPKFIFPSPLQVWHSLYEEMITGALWENIGLSMERMFKGYAISVVLGLAVGILAARSWFFKETFGAGIMALQSLPSICWLPLALIWFGLNEKAILAVLILGALFSIAVATEGAIRNVAPIYLKVGRVMGARGFTFAKDILFFAALPELIGGLKLGWTFAWRSLMAAELIRQDVRGVGHMLEVARGYNDVSLMIATIITILVIGLLVDSLVFGTLERIIRRRYGLEKD